MYISSSIFVFKKNLVSANIWKVVKNLKLGMVGYTRSFASFGF